MKTFALNLTASVISTVELFKKSLHHVEVGSYSKKQNCPPFTCPTIARAAERQSDYNYFRFKQIEEVNNQIDF